jgi:hypothetical protein
LIVDQGSDLDGVGRCLPFWDLREKDVFYYRLELTVLLAALELGVISNRATID